MYSEKAFELVKDLKRSMRTGLGESSGIDDSETFSNGLCAFDYEKMRSALDEMKALFDANTADVAHMLEHDVPTLLPSVQIRYVFTVPKTFLDFFFN